MRRLAAGLALLVAGGCVDESFRIGDDGYELPATLEDVLPHAQTVATAWDDDAYVWGMGGEYTVTDSTARAHDHSFRFYSRRLRRRLDLHLFSGTPWATEEFKWPPPTPVSVNPPAVGSAAAAEALVTVAHARGIPIPETLTARYLGFPVWPERPQDPDDQVLAWRVDFLEFRDPVWWSILRAYVDPASGDTLEVIHREEQYPDPP